MAPEKTLDTLLQIQGRKQSNMGSVDTPTVRHKNRTNMKGHITLVTLGTLVHFRHFLTTSFTHERPVIALTITTPPRPALANRGGLLSIVILMGWRRELQAPGSGRSEGKIWTIPLYRYKRLVR